MVLCFFFFSSRRRHTRCALVTGVQTCALPISGNDAVDSATRAAGRIGETARKLADSRIGRMRDLVRAHPDLLEMTDVGPAVRGEIIAVDPDPAALAAAREAGFTIVWEDDFQELGLRSVTLAAPRGLSLEEAMERLEDVAPGGDL